MYEREISLPAYKYVMNGNPATRLSYYQQLFREERDIALHSFDTKFFEQYKLVRNKTEDLYGVVAKYFMDDTSFKDGDD